MDSEYRGPLIHIPESLFGIKIRTFGFGGNFKRRSLIIMNHVTHMDWMYLWDVVDKQGHLSYWKAVTKRLPVREIPIIGMLHLELGHAELTNIIDNNNCP